MEIDGDTRIDGDILFKRRYKEINDVCLFNDNITIFLIL